VCGHHVGWFSVQCSRAACPLVLMYVSIRLRERVSEFRSIERFSTVVTTQQLLHYDFVDVLTAIFDRVLVTVMLPHIIESV